MRKATQSIDYTNRDYEAYRTMMIEDLQKKMPEYTDTSQSDAGIVIIECLANGLDIMSMYADIIANDCFLPTTQDRKTAVLLARQLGYTPRNQTAATIEQVFTLTSAQTRPVTIPKGSIVHTSPSADMETVYFETLDDLTIPAGKLGNEKDTDNTTYLYKVKAQQGSTVKEDVLGSSDGQPYQQFQLSYKEVLTDTIQLYVNEGNGFELWNQVDNFLDSDLNDKDYIVSVDEFKNCTIEFGSGTRGKIPEIYDNGIIASYRIGGGTIGNVQPNTVNVYQGSVAYVASTFNPEAPIEYGREEEDIEEIRENAPAAFRTQDRAITADDYADLLRLNFSDAILDAIGIPNTTTKLQMDLYYMLRENQTMSAGLKQEIEDWFAARTIPGTILNLQAGSAYSLDMQCRLIVNDDYDAEQIKEYVEDYVKNTFLAYGNIKFGDSFAKIDLECKVKSTFEGIESFRINTPTTDIISATNDYQYISPGTITITVSGGKKASN